MQLKSADGHKLFSDTKRALARWSEHFQRLLNVPGAMAAVALDHIQQSTSKIFLDEDITILPADKGKILNLLDDSNTYEKLKRDPTSSYKKKVMSGLLN